MILKFITKYASHVHPYLSADDVMTLAMSQQRGRSRPSRCNFSTVSFLSHFRTQASRFSTKKIRPLL